MDTNKQRNVSEREAMEVAEAAREKDWKQPSFMRELFLGNFRMDLVYPFPMSDDERPEFAEYFRKLEKYLLEHMDLVLRIDVSGEYPEELVDGLRKMGAFGMKISKDYGGLGFNQVEYGKVMQLLGTFDGSLAALLSAHQSIGVPQPLKLFGSPELKKKYLPRCAAGDISAFALTEPEVGSDPARLSTTADLNDAGDAYILNGTKLWCTNGTIAKLLVVMAIGSKSKKISAFVVETDWPGVIVERRCHFMGLKGLANAVIRFDNVRIPKENLIGAEGKGLKIALTTLNDGRLSIPSGAVGAAKMCLEICKRWGNERVQWGKPVGKHEAVAQMIANMAAVTFAMESIASLACEMSNRGGYDIRLEAAAAKEWNTCRGWELIDDAMQIRGGRGYETEASLAARGEDPIGVERMMRDFRINKIFEGSSEIMHLFMAREAVDKHLQVAGALIDPKKSLGEKLGAFPSMAGFYAWWYPTRWLGWGRWPRYSKFGKLATHLRFVERSSRKLAREVFHGMVAHGPKLQNKQAFLFHVVDVANELFAMAASISRAQTMRDQNRPEARKAGELADVSCKIARRKVRASFKSLWNNDDNAKYRLALNVLKGEHDWIQQGVPGLEALIEAARTKPAAAKSAPAAPEKEPVGA